MRKAVDEPVVKVGAPVAVVARAVRTMAPPRWVEVWRRPEASPFSPSRTPLMPWDVSGKNAAANVKPATANAGSRWVKQPLSSGDGDDPRGRQTARAG
jgi:hypothetical protein